MRIALHFAACPPKTFKSSGGNFKCKKCGANVVDGRSPRTTICQCKAGFYKPLALLNVYYVDCEGKLSGLQNIYEKNALKHESTGLPIRQIGSGNNCPLPQKILKPISKIKAYFFYSTIVLPLFSLSCLPLL